MSLGTSDPPDAAASGDTAEDVASSPSPSASASEAGPGARPPWWHRPWLVPAAIVGLAMALPFWGLWIAPGPPMEEGFMLVFPERVLAGDVPNRDFLHLYGPGSLWVLAGFFEVFGVQLWVERLVGLLQIAALVVGITTVGYRWGRVTAVAAGLVATIIIMPPIQFTALAWVGGVALALWAVILAVSVFDAPPEIASAEPTMSASQTQSRLFWAGLLAGFALLFRPDLVIAVGLSFGAMGVWGFTAPQRRRVIAGLAVGVAPYLVHLVLAGPGNAVTGMVLEPIFTLRPGRRLPFPPSTEMPPDSFLSRAFVFHEQWWPVPTLARPMQIFVWVFALLAVCAVLVAVGVRARRAGSPDGWRLLALSLLALGFLPQAIQRPDTAHLAWVSCVAFGLVPPMLVEWVRLRGARPRLRAAAALLPLVATIVVIPHFTLRWYSEYVGASFGYSRDGHIITHRGRTYYYGRQDVADAAEDMLADVEELSEPGQRLIVGPSDLRFTPYSEVYLYYLLPQLEPGTRYIEMDPGVANAEDSGLADELRAADLVILSTVYDSWEEPNTSTEPGSDEPNQVLEDEYCLHETYGEQPGLDPPTPIYELYTRC